MIAWKKANGELPEGKLVLHHCDNPPCCNPAHLYAGTHADNARDRKVRDRGTKGRAVNTNVLSEDDVYAIREATGVTQRTLAERYGVTQPLISQIRRRKTWTWLPERDN